MKTLITFLFLYGLIMSYFAGFEIYYRVEKYTFKKRGYEIVTLVHLPDGIEDSYMQQARAEVRKEQHQAMTSVVKVELPKIEGIN